MRLTHSDDPTGRRTLTVEGDVDLAAADELRDAGRDALSARPLDSLYLDLSRVTFLDSTGLNALITIRNTASARVILVSPSPAVRRILQLTALEQAFEIENEDVP